jgi:hypothetical protein
MGDGEQNEVSPYEMYGCIYSEPPITAVYSSLSMITNTQ